MESMEWNSPSSRRASGILAASAWPARSQGPALSSAARKPLPVSWTDIMLYILWQLTRRGYDLLTPLSDSTVYHLSVSWFFSQHDPIRPSPCDAKIIKKAWFLMPHVATHFRIQNIHFSQELVIAPQEDIFCIVIFGSQIESREETCCVQVPGEQSFAAVSLSSASTSAGNVLGRPPWVKDMLRAVRFWTKSREPENSCESWHAFQSLLKVQGRDEEGTQAPREHPKGEEKRR